MHDQVTTENSLGSLVGYSQPETVHRGFFLYILLILDIGRSCIYVINLKQRNLHTCTLQFTLHFEMVWTPPYVSFYSCDYEPVLLPLLNANKAISFLDFQIFFCTVFQKCFNEQQNYIYVLMRYP